MTMLRHSNLEWKFIIHRPLSFQFNFFHSLPFSSILFHSSPFSAILFQDYFSLHLFCEEETFLILLANSLLFSPVLAWKSTFLNLRRLSKTAERMFSETNFQIFSTLLSQCKHWDRMNKNAFFKQKKKHQL